MIYIWCICVSLLETCVYVLAHLYAPQEEKVADHTVIGSFLRACFNQRLDQLPIVHYCVLTCMNCALPADASTIDMSAQGISKVYYTRGQCSAGSQVRCSC